MFLIDHPIHFKTGTRVLFLKGRHKDGIKQERTLLRITHSAGEFDHALHELAEQSVEGERIYGSVSERSLLRAIREFRQRQLDAEYNNDTLGFYRRLMDRWSFLPDESEGGRLQALVV